MQIDFLLYSSPCPQRRCKGVEFVNAFHKTC